MDIQHSKIIETTRELLKSYGFFVDHLWHVDDVHFICEQHNLEKISDKEAMQVFDVAVEQFDGESGISWPQLEKALHVFLARRKLLSPEHAVGPPETMDNMFSK